MRVRLSPGALRRPGGWNGRHAALKRRALTGARVRLPPWTTMEGEPARCRRRLEPGGNRQVWGSRPPPSTSPRARRRSSARATGRRPGDGARPHSKRVCVFTGVGFESSAFRMESERWLVGGPPGKRCGLEKGLRIVPSALRSPGTSSGSWVPARLLRGELLQGEAGSTPARSAAHHCCSRVPGRSSLNPRASSVSRSFPKARRHMEHSS